MSFYADHVLPHLINLAMRNRELLAYRKRVIPAAEGRVLEIGIGSGLNLPFYQRAHEVLGLDPSPRLAAMAEAAARRCSIPVRVVEGTAEHLPLDAQSIDTVVTTWTLCSIPQASVALEEMRRVLKPNGQLLFVEHGRAPEESVRKWQDRLTPVWKRIGGGCHLNRPIRELVEGAGFSISHLDIGYMRGPRPLTFMYEGRAKRQ
jgi:ubiquinone/menaquinone biosynthesis C-methylase UbiE